MWAEPGFEAGLWDAGRLWGLWSLLDDVHAGFG